MAALRRKGVAGRSVQESHAWNGLERQARRGPDTGPAASRADPRDGSEADVDPPLGQPVQARVVAEDDRRPDVAAEADPAEEGDARPDPRGEHEVRRGDLVDD